MKMSRRSAFRAGIPDSGSKTRQPSSRPPFRRDWLGIRFSSWNAGFQLEKRIPKTTFITAPFQDGLAGDPLFELECRIPARKADPQDNLSIPARKADPQDNLHHGPLSGGIGWGSTFRAGMPDSSSKSGSPTQPSSRPPFRRDWPGIRWNAGFQLEKRIPKTTFITAPFQEGLAFRAGMPDSSSKSGQDNLHHGPLSGGIGRGSAFRAGMPHSSSKSGSSRQPSSRPTAPFQEGLAGDPLFELDAGFQLEKRIPKTTFITAPFQEGLAGDPLFELECRIPARKADPQDNLHHGRPPFRRDWLGIRFGFQLEKRIPKTTFITAPFQEGLAGDPLFELECRIPAGKADPQDNLHHGPLSGGIGWGSTFRAGLPDSSSKSGSPTQPSSRPPFRRDWPGIRWNAGFQLEKRIPKTTFITAPFQEGLAGDPLFELECRIPARKADPPFQEGLAGDPLFKLECRIPARKADPQDNLHHGPLSGGIGLERSLRKEP